MSTPENIRILFDCDLDDLDADVSRLEQLVKDICEEFDVRNADIHIRITGDEGITEVHRQFLKSETTTDVISFDLSDEFEDSRSLQYVVNAEMACRQGQERGHSTEAELALYITHGMLHHLGYDDTDETQSARMHEKEDDILQKNGFGVIYHHDETPNTKEND